LANSADACWADFAASAAARAEATALARNIYNPKINMLQGDIYLLQGNKKYAKRSYEMAMKHPWLALQAKDKLNTFAK
jgi:predicted negative regulator of RcsB-dependent stress response